ncbi:MAG: 30S ribosomal protein S17 [Desulfurococcales archaeon]|nr:30S ribosomal protein S17 [Desulfurococcales archaeon]
MPAQKTVKNLKIPGVKPPEKVCNDPNCPWHGRARVRGVILEGTVVKARAKRTVVVRHEYLYYDPKYKRYERRSKKIHAHLPDCIEVKPGDLVVVGETRPISKTVKFVVLGVKKSS